NPETIRWGIALASALAVVGPLTIGLGALVGSVRLLAVALGVGLGPLLSVGGPILVGLGLLSAAFVKNRLDALAATSALDEFGRSLQGLSRQQLVNVGADIVGQIEALRQERERLAALNPLNVLGTSGAGVPARQIEQLDEQIADLEARLDRVRTAFDAVGEAADDAFGDGGLGGAVAEISANLAAILREAEVTSIFGAFDVRDLPQGLRDAFQAAESLHSRIQELNDELQVLEEPGVAAPGAALELMDRRQRGLERANEVLAEQVRTLGRAAAEIAVPQFGVTIGGVFIQNPEEIREEYERQVRQTLEEERIRSQLNLELVPVVSRQDRFAEIAGPDRNAAVQQAREATQAFNDSVQAGT